MSTISHLGTFDVENYGDLLYPLVFNHLLKRRDSSLTAQQFSFLPGPAPQEAGFETRPVQTLFDAEQAQNRTLVIGGGDILRTDWETVAVPYSRFQRDYIKRLKSALGITTSLQYLMLKQLRGPLADRFFRDRFRQRRMEYPTAGPFLIDPADLPGGGSVSYLSCGVPHDFAPVVRDRVRHTFEQAEFIYLRDEQSAEKLRRCGMRREMHVAPDLIVTLSEQFDREAERRKGLEILSKLGVNFGQPVLCFQSKRFSGFNAKEIVAELNLYRRRSGSQVVLLPIGYCHGDAGFLQGVAKASGGGFKCADVYSVFDIISVIAASDFFIGTSLHGNITAFSFGIPHLLGPLPVDKAEGFLNVVNLPPELKLRSWAEMNDKIDMVSKLGRALFLDRAREAKLTVYRVVEHLLEQLLK